MPSTLVSKCEDLVPVLTKIIDNSLHSGPFPDIWKEALVFPLLKKPGVDVIFKMFRPISNLSFVSKLIERDAFNQIHGHLVSNNLHPVSNNLHPVAQSAHRKKSQHWNSTSKSNRERYSVKSEQAVRYYPCIAWSQCCFTVNHSILLDRLSSKLGLNGTALDWFRSSKSQFGAPFDLRHGVPQGSCLDLLLFTVYASALFWCRRKAPPSCSLSCRWLSLRRTLPRLMELLLSNIFIE